MTEFYKVRVTTHSDADAEASFYIEPPVRFLNPEAQQKLAYVVRNLILHRMGVDEDHDLRIDITHNLPDDSATVGRAHFRGLQLATGAVVLQQALELGLNGTNEFVSPESPLRG